MLWLTRYSGQTIHIGDEITLKVHHVGRKYVKIGIDAPQEFHILRGEHLEQQDTLPVSTDGQEGGAS